MVAPKAPTVPRPPKQLSCDDQLRVREREGRRVVIGSRPLRGCVQARVRRSHGTERGLVAFPYQLHERFGLFTVEDEIRVSGQRPGRHTKLLLLPEVRCCQALEFRGDRVQSARVGAASWPELKRRLQPSASGADLEPQTPGAPKPNDDVVRDLLTSQPADVAFVVGLLDKHSQRIAIKPSEGASEVPRGDTALGVSALPFTGLSSQRHALAWADGGTPGCRTFFGYSRRDKTGPLSPPSPIRAN